MCVCGGGCAPGPHGSRAFDWREVGAIHVLSVRHGDGEGERECNGKGNENGDGNSEVQILRYFLSTIFLRFKFCS